MNEQESPANRRDFVKTLTLGAVAAPLPFMVRDDPPKADAPKETPKTTEVDARMEWILQRFGAQLDDEARKEVRSEVESIVARSEQLRKLDLDNGDAPFPIFVPYRGSVS